MMPGRHENSSAGARKAALTDAALVQAARRGDKRAFVEIVARHQAMVCGVALGILGDFAGSEDAAQEAFLTAWRKLHELREPERLRAWLGQIARHAALGQLRRRRGHDPLEEAAIAVDDAPAPDELAAQEEEATMVRDCLAKLPEPYRLPLILFYREGQSVRAVAEALGLSEDTVKQRLARGRDMLRDRMEGLIETVLTRTMPTTVFTMMIAAAIGALAAPAAVAGSVFASSLGASAGAGSVSASAPVLTAMSTSKSLLVTAALVTVVCIPVGYHVHTDSRPPANTNRVLIATPWTAPETKVEPASYESSALFAEWRQLHDIHGRSKEAMPALYKAIADLKDPFQRRTFRAALLAEWAQVDPAGGLAYFLRKDADGSQRRQFLQEWLGTDPAAAVAALLSSGPGWESAARDGLEEIAKKVPERIPEIVSRLPQSDNFWDTQVRDAFSTLAEKGLDGARTAAEALTGANRTEALAGVARIWAKRDLAGAVAWAKGLPDGVDHDEIVRAAMLGKASTDPIAALDLVGSVPPGGRQGYFATTTGARVLKEAVAADFDSTVAWLAAHPGRMGHEDMMGISDAVTARLNADPLGFLNRHAEDGSLKALLPALSSALLNDSAGQRSKVWDWLKQQAPGDLTDSIKQSVLNSAGYQDPELAMKFVSDIPSGEAGDKDVALLARSLLNGGSMLQRFDKLMEQAPERLRGVLLENAFGVLRGDYLDDPQRWIARLPQLPEATRPRATESIAKAWAQETPEDAVGWAASMAPGETRTGVVGAIASTWATKDAPSAAEWVASMAPGKERDHGAQSLVYAIGDKYPQAAWDWALSIDDNVTRSKAAAHVAKTMIDRDPTMAATYIENGPLTPEAKAELRSTLARRAGASSAR